MGTQVIAMNPGAARTHREVIQREAVLRQGALGFLLKDDDR